MIVVFDSGLGGLSVLKYFLKSLPDYNYIYLGDNARKPYGSRSADIIYNYTKEAINFLFFKKCEIFNSGEIITESFKKYINKHTKLKIKKSIL